MDHLTSQSRANSAGLNGSRFLWMRRVPCGERLSVFMLHVLAVVREQNQIVVTVIKSVVVQVMHTLARIEDSTESFLHHKTMLKDVTVSVCMRVTGCVDVGVPFHNGSAATPIITKSASAGLVMALHKSSVLSFADSSRGVVCCSNTSGLSAPTFTGVVHGYESIGKGV